VEQIRLPAPVFEGGEHRPERLACVDRVQELLPYLDREPLLRSCSVAGSLSVSARTPAQAAVASSLPAGDLPLGGSITTGTAVITLVRVGEERLAGRSYLSGYVER
jgi:hypothetical protein